MFSDALKKRFESIPDVTPQQAEAAYWKTPTVQMGSALKLVGGLESGAALDGAKEALDAADRGIEEMTKAITRLCAETGVDPDQPLEAIVESLVSLVNAANKGEGETTDDAKLTEETVTADEVGSVTEALPAATPADPA